MERKTVAQANFPISIEDRTATRRTHAVKSFKQTDANCLITAGDSLMSFKQVHVMILLFSPILEVRLDCERSFERRLIELLSINVYFANSQILVFTKPATGELELLVSIDRRNPMSIRRRLRCRISPSAPDTDDHQRRALSTAGSHFDCDSRIFPFDLGQQ